MYLGHIDVGPIFASSGTFGFRGEGYRWHKWIWPFMIVFKLLSTHIMKTVTIDRRKGNMLLNDDSTPMEKMPKSVFISLRSWLRGGMLNAIALSNFGVKWYLERGWWASQTKPFGISFMPMGTNSDVRMQECREFVRLMREHWHKFQVRIFIELNITCPNTEHDLTCFVQDVGGMLDILEELGSIIIKGNLGITPEQAKGITSHKACSAYHTSNTESWATLPDWIKWKVFGMFESPLKQFGGGGYSGKHLHAMVVAWIARAREIGIEKPIICGGGIFTPLGVWRAKKAGADAISIGSPMILRPFWVPFTVFAAWLLYE